MSTSRETSEPHLAQYIEDANRDFHWNRDQVQLVVDRLGLHNVETMLDVVAESVTGRSCSLRSWRPTCR